MCGIYGYYGKGEAASSSAMDGMAKTLHHRGPDGRGYYADDLAGLGNVRLAIIDPEGGEQPYFSEDGDVIVVQNGEIFNFHELRKTLEKGGTHFKSDCDTEVLLHLYLKYGIAFLNKLNGMFAIAIYDKKQKKMYLARDRIGEKPLYFSDAGGQLYFASEIKAFLPYIEKSVNIDAINAFLRLNYVPAPHTAFSGVFHVMPGTYLEISDTGVAENRWWDLADREINFDKSESQWKSEFNDLLDKSVSLRLVSDVPFGAFLSGGVDSTSVVGLMARHMEAPVKTYSIGFPDPRFDESEYAQQASELFATEHHSEIVDYDIVSEWSDFIYHCDQPHGDVSFMPMKKVSELAAADVKMVLTGDGADELFAGYEKHVPFLSKGGVDDLTTGEFKAGYMPYLTLYTDAACKELWNEQYVTEINWEVADNLVESLLERCKHFDGINRGLFLDMEMLLPGNNLVKPDRMAMSQSLETRAPFLDYRMMEFAFTMPGEFKLKDRDKKHLYKQAVIPLIGKGLAYRKKQMFTVPIGEWFKGELNEYCHDLLLSSESRVLEYFKLELIKNMLGKHMNSEKNYTREIRALISIELWLRRFFEE